jgi:nitroreductase
MEQLELMQTSTTIESSILESIQKRRSRRAYTDQTVEAEKIKTLFEAARWAPSSVNEQPWMYIYATREQHELWQKIFDSLNDGNKIWVKDAPLLIVSLARRDFTRSGRPNASSKYDLGAANAFLCLQATELGLNVHQLGGFDPWILRENLSIPETYELGVVMAVGYPGDANSLPENLKLRELAPRQRYVQEEFVMNKSF